MFHFLNSVKVPLFLLLLLSLFEILARLGILPPSADVSFFINSALNTYGLAVIGLLALFENIVGLNIYFPGSIVILTTMAASAGNLSRAVAIFLIYYVFAIIAYHIDYFMGRSLQSKNIPTPNSKLWLRFLIMFSHPQIASILCVQIGSEGYRYKQIIPYLLLFTFLWVLIWSVIMYSIGMITGHGVDFRLFAYVYLIGLFVYDTYEYFKIKTNHLLQN